MSWLKNIYESIVNEIGADDAYRRFYSSIPREDYDYILGGDPAPDKFIQFVLNCVRDGSNDKEEARETIDKFKKSDELIRQNILQKFKTGEYEDCVDILSDINYFSSGGAILSRKKFAKEGYIKVKENDHWLVTCTTNYTASNHYFGDTHWCTASDRDGEYDGYNMFKNYTTTEDYESGKKNCTSVLFQFTWKGKVRDDDDKPEPLDESEGPLSDSEYNGWNEDEIDKRYSKIQAQVNVKNKSLEQICDFYDTSMSNNKLKSIVGDEIFYSVLEEDVLQWLQEREQSQLPKESDYQEKYDAAKRQKRERLLRLSREERNRLNDEATEHNKQKEKLVLEKWEEFKSQKLYIREDIIAEIIKRDVYGDYGSVTEDTLSKTNYAAITNFEVSRPDGVSNVIYGFLSPVLGDFENLDYDYDRYDIPKWRIYNEISTTRVDGSKSIAFVCYASNNGPVQHLKIIGDNFGENANVRPLSCDIYTKNDVRLGGGVGTRFSVFSFYSTYEGETHIIDMITMNEIEGVDVPIALYYEINDDLFVLYKDGNGEEFDYYKPSIGKAFNSQNYGRTIFELNYGEGISLVGNGTNRLYYRDLLPENGFTLKTNRAVSSIDYYSLNNSKVIGVTFEYGGANAFETDGDGELIFGVKGESVHVNNQERVSIVFEKDKKRCLLTYDVNDGYFLVGEGKIIPCDKFGKTEKDRIADKNFSDWKANGGHSPEAKAQMDKMWADRNGEDIMSGEGAFRDWNDNDRNLDSNASNAVETSGLKNIPFFKSIVGDSLDGANYGALKDPNGYADQIGDYMRSGDFDFNKEAPDYIRRNPWYRIGKDGKPMDQPWYDEDEVPARLSDRVVREQKINEGINKMKSIWDRMGLND